MQNATLRPQTWIYSAHIKHKAVSKVQQVDDMSMKIW